MDNDSPGYPDYRPLGFVANPFVEWLDRQDAYWVPQLARAEANRLLRAVDREAGSTESKPLLLQHAETMPDFYLRPAVNDFLRLTALDERLNVLAFNVGLDMMRLGRIRGTLTELAELVAAADFDLTLAAYAGSVLSDPDPSLPEHEALSAVDLRSVAESFSSRPAEAVAEHFGSLEAARKPDEDANAVLFEAYLRSVGLEPDPSEADSAEEDLSADAGAPVVPGTPDGPVPAEEREADAPEGGSRPAAAAVADYVIAHARAHLSPVVARAVRAYVNDGFSAVAQELKVTKAPKKTLAAVARFATFRWRKLVVMYDRFDSWPILDEETKALVVGSLSELRWALRPSSVFAIMLPHGLAPEIEEQFAAAERIEWEFAGVEERIAEPDRLDRAMVGEWLDAAALSGSSPVPVEDPCLESLFAFADGSLSRFGVAASAAFEHAALRGGPALEEADVEHGMAAVASGPGEG